MPASYPNPRRRMLQTFPDVALRVLRCLLPLMLLGMPLFAAAAEPAGLPGFTSTPAPGG